MPKQQGWGFTLPIEQQCRQRILQRRKYTVHTGKGASAGGGMYRYQCAEAGVKSTASTGVEK